LETAVPELTLDSLISTARPAGVHLTVTTNPIAATLYAYMDAAGVIWYLGKAESAGGRRHSDEISWFGQPRPFTELRLGLEAAVSEHHLERHMLAVADWRRSVADRLLSTWSGPGIDRARTELPENLTPTQVERFLIRVAVATGTRLLNSQGASMWEGPLGSFSDTLAQVAVYAQKEASHAGEHPADSAS
jgi:hypothetical protein